LLGRALIRNLLSLVFLVSKLFAFVSPGKPLLL